MATQNIKLAPAHFALSESSFQLNDECSLMLGLQRAGYRYIPSMRLVHGSTHFQLDLVEYELILSDQLNVRGLIEAHFEDSYQSFHKNNINVSKNIEVAFVENPRAFRLIFKNGSITINENSFTNLCRLEPAINKTMVRLQKLSLRAQDLIATFLRCLHKSIRCGEDYDGNRDAYFLKTLHALYPTLDSDAIVFLNELCIYYPNTINLLFNQYAQ